MHVTVKEYVKLIFMGHLKRICIRMGENRTNETFGKVMFYLHSIIVLMPVFKSTSDDVFLSIFGGSATK